MTGPDFDELIGGDLSGPERDRLRWAHDLLLAAGPPAELPPELEAGPTLGMTLARPRGQFRRRATLLLAATVAIAIVFIGGYAAGNSNNGSAISVVRTLDLKGTQAAPRAFASLRVEPSDASGNWPMTLDATGLPAPPSGGYYIVYLVRDGEPWAPCGGFVTSGTNQTVTVALTAPYGLTGRDRWVVTLWFPGVQGHGRTVLSPVSA